MWNCFFQSYISRYNDRSFSLRVLSNMLFARRVLGNVSHKSCLIHFPSALFEFLPLWFPKPPWICFSLIVCWLTAQPFPLPDIASAILSSFFWSANNKLEVWTTCFALAAQPGFLRYYDFKGWLCLSFLLLNTVENLQSHPVTLQSHLTSLQRRLRQQ